MVHDVFVSYSSPDKLIADAACHALEAEGIRCWMAPRDLQTGLDWKGSVVEAIREAQLMVLIFSGKANDSPQVKREVDIAFEAGRPIVPFRIENVTMNDGLYYCIAARHWLDALTPPIEKHIEHLVRDIAPLVAGAVDPSREVAPDDTSPTGEHAPGQAPTGTLSPGTPLPDKGVLPPRSTPKTLVRRVGLGAGIAAVLLAGWIFGSDHVMQDAMEAYAAEQYTDAYPLFMQAAEDGEADAQAYLGLLHINGEGVSQDDHKAEQWFRLAAQQGSALGQAGLGFMYLQGREVKQDDQEALRWLQLAAEQGEKRAQDSLGYMYQTGRGVKQDHAKAAELYGKAAAQDYAQAQSHLAAMYYNGDGVPRSYALARDWYLKAARQGNATAQTNLGYMYENGRGGPKDYAAARNWYLKAAAQDDAAAQSSLGAMYHFGHGVSQDYAVARSWYLKAAAKGNSVAQTNLGYMYAEGQGVQRDVAEAERWYRLAADQGSKVADTNLRAMLGDWPLDPLIPGPWRDFVGDERRAEIARLPSRLQAHTIHRLRRLDLTFYEDAALFEAEVDSAGGARGVLSYVRHGDGLVMIDGNAAQIHALNADAPLHIRNVHEAVDYLRFFVGGIQAENGRFKLVDEVEDLSWNRQATSMDKDAIGGRIKLLNVQATRTGGWTATGTVEYAGTLFSADFSFSADGTVNMTNDTLIADQLKIDHERFNDQGIRLIAMQAGANQGVAN